MGVVIGLLWRIVVIIQKWVIQNRLTKFVKFGLRMWTPLPSTGTGTAKKSSGTPHIDHFNFIISLLLFISYFFCYTQFFGKQIEDITCPRVDMNFIFEWSTRYLTSEPSQRVKFRVEHEKIKFISISEYVIFCLLCKHQRNTNSACFQRGDLLCNHNDGDLFTCFDNMLSSRVKI